jgi:hypothetical protein
MGQGDSEGTQQEEFPREEASSNIAQLEFLKYLTEDHGFGGALVQNLYAKFNAIIPSSAPVERLFSRAGVISTARRARLNPNLLEKLVLLSANKILENQPWW